MTTRTRMMPGARYASGHTSQEFDQTQALRRLVGGPITTRPYWSMDDHRVQILESLRAQGLAACTETPDSVPKYTVRTYTATERARQIAAEDEARRRSVSDVLADDQNWRCKVKNLMQQLRRTAKAQPERRFPDKSWMAHQVLIAMQSPLWTSDNDEETGEVVFSSPELTAAYVAQFEQLNHLRRAV